MTTKRRGPQPPNQGPSQDQDARQPSSQVCQLLARIEDARLSEFKAFNEAEGQERAARRDRVAALHALADYVNRGHRLSPSALEADREEVEFGWLVLAEHGGRPAMPLSPGQLGLFAVAGGRA